MDASGGGGVLHHVALGALDVARVAEFYRSAFELPELRVQEDELSVRSIWLGLRGGAVLMIERVDLARASVVERSSGPFLLAFEVAPAAREAAERRLVALGATIESRTDFTSYARDPEGNRVAISCYALPRSEEGGTPG